VSLFPAPTAPNPVFSVTEITQVVRRLLEEAIGSVSVDDQWLRTLYVVPEHWSHGVGSALLEHALVRMRERGATRAKLWTLEDNESARRFYERRGWRLTAETRIVPFPPHPIDVQYSKEL